MKNGDCNGKGYFTLTETVVGVRIRFSSFLFSGTQSVHSATAKTEMVYLKEVVKQDISARLPGSVYQQASNCRIYSNIIRLYVPYSIYVLPIIILQVTLNGINELQAHHMKNKFRNIVNQINTEITVPWHSLSLLAMPISTVEEFMIVDAITKTHLSSVPCQKALRHQLSPKSPVFMKRSVCTMIIPSLFMIKSNVNRSRGN